MSINLATKYAESIVSSFSSCATVSDKGAEGYEFTGVKGIKVYTPITVPMVDYQRTGGSRFGDLAEMQDTVQELLLSQDKAFTFAIDKGNNTEQMQVKEAGRMMALQISERVVPAVETHCIGNICRLAGNCVSTATAITESNVMDAISNAATAFDEALVPTSDRYLVVTPSLYSSIRLAPDFLAVDALAKDAVEKGVLGSVFGFNILKVPTAFMPSDFYFVAFHKNAVIFPNKLKDARLHEDAPGISGAIVEGRWIYDAFVLGARANGVYSLVKTASRPANPSGAYASGSVTITGGTGTFKIYYTVDGTDPRYSTTVQTYSTPLAVSTLPDDVTLQIVGMNNTGIYSEVVAYTPD